MKELQPELKNAVINQTSVEYLCYAGSEPSIIMLHATGFMPWLWHPIAKRIAGPKQVIAPYFCDHRNDEPEDGGVSWLILAQDLFELCKTLVIEKPLLVGHSMGATIITLASALYGLNAEKIVLIEPIYLPEKIYSADLTVEEHPLASKSIKRRNGWANRDETLAYLRSKSLFKSWDAEALELYLQYGFQTAESGGLTLACSPRREAALFMGGLSYNPWPLLDKITSPTLVLEGETSVNRSYIDLKKAASLMQNGYYKLVEGAGHLIPMENPAQTSNIIKEFFNLT